MTDKKILAVSQLKKVMRCDVDELHEIAEMEQTRLCLRRARVLQEGLMPCAHAKSSTQSDGTNGLPEWCKAVECKGEGNEDACPRFMEVNE